MSSIMISFLRQRPGTRRARPGGGQESVMGLRGSGAAGRLDVPAGRLQARASRGGVLWLNSAGAADPPRKAGGGISAPRRAAVAGACLVVAAGLAAGGCSRSQPGTASCLSGPAAGGPPGTAPVFGTYATTPVVVDGVVYTQDLQSNVIAIGLATGRVLWKHAYNSQNGGPDGVNVVNGSVYAATGCAAVALDAATGRQLWSRTLVRNDHEGI